MKMPAHARALLYTDWTLTEPEFDPAQLHVRETVFTIGNGYLGARGSFEESLKSMAETSTPLAVPLHTQPCRSF